MHVVLVTMFPEPEYYSHLAANSKLEISVSGCRLGFASSKVRVSLTPSQFPGNVAPYREPGRIVKTGSPVVKPLNGTTLEECDRAAEGCWVSRLEVYPGPNRSSALAFRPRAGYRFRALRIAPLSPCLSESIVGSDKFVATLITLSLRQRRPLKVDVSFVS